MFKQIKLILWYATMPLSSATAERTFSAMRRLKTWLRTTMCENQITNRMFAVLHKSRMQAVDINKVAKEFINSGDMAKRLAYFGKALNLEISSCRIVFSG